MEKWKHPDTGKVYTLSKEEIKHLEDNGAKGVVVPIPRTGYSLTGEDYSLSSHGCSSGNPPPTESE